LRTLHDGWWKASDAIRSGFCAQGGMPPQVRLPRPKTKESPSLLGQKALLVYLSGRAFWNCCVSGFYPTFLCYAIQNSFWNEENTTNLPGVT
jgi:hypothetical protein